MTLVRYIILVFTYSSLFGGNAPALESARLDFKKTNLAYSKIAGLSMDTYYSVYADHHSKEMLEGKTGTYLKFEDNTFTRIADIETYTIGDKIININNGNKQITVGDNLPIGLSPLETDSDSLLAMCMDIKVKNVSAAERKYELYFDNAYGGEYSRMDVCIDTKNLRYTKIILYYSAKVNLKQDFYGEEKQPRLEIDYKNPKLIQSPPLIFNQDLYVLNVNGRLKPAPRYYNYKISDLRNETRIKTQKKPK